MEMKDNTKKIGAALGAMGVAFISAVSLSKYLKSRSKPVLLAKALEKREEELQSQYGERLKCVHCKYCKRRLYAPFFSHPVKHWVPLYCKKFLFTLPADVTLRCGALLPEDAQREGK